MVLWDLSVWSLPVCESCLEGKMTKRSFSAKGTRAKEPLQLVHSDVCGPVSVQAIGGYEYFVTFIDDYSRYGYVYLMQRKSETFGKFKEFLAEAEKCWSEKIILRSRSNRKNKTSGSVVPRSFKNFQNSFESLGFIHVYDTLKQQAINHIDIVNCTHIMLFNFIN